MYATEFVQGHGIPDRIRPPIQISEAERLSRPTQRPSQSFTLCDVGSRYVWVWYSLELWPDAVSITRAAWVGNDTTLTDAEEEMAYAAIIRKERRTHEAN
jgi:hypothetical protein